MEAIVSEQENEKHVRIVGRLDTVRATALEEELDALLAPEPTNIIINCDQLTYISSSGLRVFLTLQKRLMQVEKKLIVIDLLPDIRRVFDMTGFSSIFIIK